MTKRNKPVTVECHNCKTEFKAHVSYIKKGGGKFCSVKCRNQGWGYQNKILAMLPASVEQIKRTFNMSSVAVCQLMRRIMKEGLCHPAELVRDDMRKAATTSAYTLMIRPGPQPEENTLPLSIRGAMEVLIPELLMNLMPATEAQLVAKTGLCRGTIRKIIKQLREGEKRQIYISGWARTHGRPIARYRVGQKPDAPCKLKKFTQAERTERYIAKLRKTGRYREHLDRHNASQRATIQRRAGDPLVNALFGKPAERLKAA